MIKDNRKSKRRPVRLAAWMALRSDNPTRCILSDISNRGARIKVEDSGNVPDRFVLLLARNGSARRFCHVVWRQEGQIGVSFKTGQAAAIDRPMAPGKNETAAAPPAPSPEAAKDADAAANAAQ